MRPLVLLLGAFCLASCGGERELFYLPQAYQEASWEEGRALNLKEAELPSGTTLSLPDSIRGYRFEKPLAIAGGIVGGKCVFAVSDLIDRAVHWWSAAGTYLGSADGGRRDTTKLPWAGTLAISAGHTIVGDSRAMRLLLAKPGSVRAIANLDPKSVSPGFRIAPAGSGIVVHRYGVGLASALSELSSTRDLLAELDNSGTLVATGAPAEWYPTAAFTRALNEGLVARRGDTTIVVNSATARVTRYVRDADSVLSPVGAARLHALFTSAPPVQLVPRSGRGGEVLVERHVLDFAVDDHGDWLALQAKEYAPLGSEEEGTPRAMRLIAYSAQGTPIAAYILRDQALAIATSGQSVAILQRSPAGRGNEVTILRHDALWHRSGAQRASPAAGAPGGSCQ